MPIVPSDYSASGRTATLEADALLRLPALYPLKRTSPETAPAGPLRDR